MANRHLRKRKRNNGRRCVSVVVFLLAGVMLIRMAVLYQKNEDYKQQEVQLSEQIKEETDRQKELEDYQSYVQSDQYVERTAKSKLGLLYENEIVFKEK
ncbi:MAG: septum formation initiator family protein [Eubacterium sp.]|nr:septum formation initiator family protein [Eubacterium sp.]